MIVEAKGRKVVVIDGPARQTHQFASEDEALDFAAELEDKRHRRMIHDVGLLVRYSDPDHPADPVLPRPGDLRRQLALIHNFEWPDDPVEVPEPDDGRQGETAARRDTEAILAELRGRWDEDRAAAEAAAEARLVLLERDAAGDFDKEHGSEAPVVVPPAPPAPVGPVVNLQLDYDAGKRSVRATMTSLTSDPVEISREVTDDDGGRVRTGKVTLEPGRELARHYDLEPGQTIVFWRTVGTVKVELGRFEAETTTDDEPVE